MFSSLFGFLLAAALATAQPVRFDLPSTDGKMLRTADLKSVRATVFVFIGTDCPISNRYSPRLQHLAHEYADKHVRFYAVFSDQASDVSSAQTYLRAYHLDFPGLLDPAVSLARQTGARVTPEVVVLSPQGEVLYRGRIDNQYVSWGKTRNTATENSLQDALEEVLAGKPVLRPITTALGCAINGLN